MKLKEISTVPKLPYAEDALLAQRHPLDYIFAPKSVAVVGATETEGSVGRSVLNNLILGKFPGNLYPVNPKRPTVLGLPAFPSVSAIPEKVDVVVIVTPSAAVPKIISECADLGIKSAIIISAGFKEVGPSGAELERQVLAEARRGGMRIIGPNCLGVMVPGSGFNATFAAGMSKPGKIGFVSQSGALCTAVLDWSFANNVGFSSFISIGSMLDVGWGDLIDYLGDDPKTEAIVMYMESVGDARAFLSAAREVALTKPIICIKVGRTEAASKAAASHTGSLTGSDEVLDAAFRRCGVLRVDTIAELFDMAEVLAKQPRPRGPRLAIVTNGGGPGALATDAFMSNGGKLSEISPATMEALNQILPPHWSHNNPIDILGDAKADRYAKAVDIVSKDEGVDGLLVVLTPQDMTEETETAEAMKPFSKIEGKPILTSWMGGTEVAKAREVLIEAGIPSYEYPDTAARAFQFMCSYTESLRSLYETPRLLVDETEEAPDRAAVEKLIAQVRASGRSLLTEYESKQVLAAYRIPTVETHLAKSADEAVAQATQLGYPVVLKLHSETITHKTDVGGVLLNLRDADAVRKAYNGIEASVRAKAGEGHFLGVTVQKMAKLEGYELILGCSPDPQFGPVLLFGAGGQLVEVFKDSALGLPPLNATLARRLMEQTKIYTALKGVRGRKSVDMAELEELLVRFSYLVTDQKWIKELDINPLLVSENGMIALDARVVLHGNDVAEAQLLETAIHPYPNQYVTPLQLKDGTKITLRPIRPEDEPLMVSFHETLSPRTVFNRYFSPLKLGHRIAHERLTRICFIDYDREMAIVAEHHNEQTNQDEILGVGRLRKSQGLDDAEFSVVVSDAWQRRGLGQSLLKTILHVAQQQKTMKISGYILPENAEMQELCKKCGFTIRQLPGRTELIAEMQMADK